MADSKPNERKQCTLVLVGRKGDGKSATGNTILGEACFTASLASDTPLTPCIKKTSANVTHGTDVNIIDTPGFFNTEVENPLVEKEITRMFELAPGGIDAFLLVLRVGRFTTELANTIKYFKELFGPEVMKYTVVIFPGLDDLEYDGETFERFLEQLPKDTKTMMPDRKVAFNNRSATSDEKKYQVARVFEHVAEMSNKKRFTKSMIPTGSPLQKVDILEERVTAKEDVTPERYRKLQRDTPKEELRLAVVGKDRDGKKDFVTKILSSFTNTSNESGEACVKYTGHIQRRKIHLLDTNDLERESIIAQSMFSMIPPGPHVLILILKVGSTNDEMEEVIKIFRELFGEDAGRFTLLVFTNIVQIKMYGSNLQAYTRNLPNNIRKLITVSIEKDMVIGFDEDKPIDEELEKVIKKIDVSIFRNQDCFRIRRQASAVERYFVKPITSAWQRCTIS